ncbi:hypothetical protein OD91_1960 [Lutibacter sp. Hel_I_33_5]|uniref:hypothetical protein n=1 Tax=Lutibacter sp. Hel_I_33_5 TaxID=1566289 RepID=UPI0011A273BB|nr:hypothetical protein [Lutibacter sp. Hel_I_33_5]TVZ56664.1 hypothetical protein OD91_1960 [Lutibacter sp. Hel_I_33_5]
MKKIIIPIVLAFSILFISCSDDNDTNDEDCTSLSKDALDKGTTWGTEKSDENCRAYKAAMQKLLDNGCLEGAAVISTQGVVDGLNCS